MRRGPILIWAGVLALVVVGGLLLGERAPAHLRLASLHVALPRQAPPKPPEALEAKLQALVAGYGEPVGVAVTDVKRGWTAGVDAQTPYPQQSVSKLWVAIAALKAVDEGRLRLDMPVTLTEADRSVFFQPVAYSIGPAGFTTSVEGLLRRAIIESDNAANDKLMRLAGGPEGVGAAIARLGLTGVKVGAYERDLQARTAGLEWRPEYGVGWNFQAARQKLPKAVREAALADYLEAPLDGAAPAAITGALAALQRGDLLSGDSTELLLGLMARARTGPLRLKGGLPPGWRLAHKTGTGQDFEGASVGINDVGVLTAPDGHAYAVAVMIRRTRQSVPDRLRFMQSITHAVADQWARENGQPADVQVTAAPPEGVGPPAR